MPMRAFELEDLVNRPGVYFNPQTEVMVIVDDSSSLDQQTFDDDDLEDGQWVLIGDEAPVDEHRRDELVDAFQVRYHPGEGSSAGQEDLVEDEDVLEPDEDPDEL